MKKVHFIAIGGSAMHGIAIALHKLGYHVTGSDDEIYNPAKDKLAQEGLLPTDIGWFPEKIHEELDFVILGMHAKPDNPELLRAQELGLKIYSYPEFIYEFSQHKHRVVVAGSHGKTTTTAMVIHVLHHCGRKFDYLIGGEVKGLPYTCRLSEDSHLIIIEGDEYPASCLDKRPKMQIYQPHILCITGLAWDHANVYPTEEIYLQQFRDTVQAQVRGTNLILNADDKKAKKLEELQVKDSHLILYETPKYRVKDNVYYYFLDDEEVSTRVIGKHNMSNIEAAYRICKKLSVPTEDFIRAISTFEGAGKRLEKIYDTGDIVVYRDFAHAPSKVKASLDAIYELYHRTSWSFTQGHQIVAVLELHTFSSLSQNYLPQYEDALKQADYKIVYVSDTVLAKKGEQISDIFIQDAFGDRKINVCRNPEQLTRALQSIQANRIAYLFMSSGTFDSTDILSIIKK
ncbi:MAG: Mur ligase family protein [Bacteroidia bacterium]|nr:Mur ligase family protein [Bacteroidia bacterium]MDW8301940.1 Mur ligase family protein [Bacteroidia bacterium]